MTAPSSLESRPTALLAEPAALTDRLPRGYRGARQLHHLADGYGQSHTLGGGNLGQDGVRLVPDELELHYRADQRNYPETTGCLKDNSRLQ